MLSISSRGTLCGLLFSLCLVAGCGTQSSTNAGFQDQGQQAPAARGSVLVNLDFTARTSASQPQFPSEAQEYTLDIVDPSTGLETVDTVVVTRTPGSNLEVNISGVPAGLQRLIVVGRSAQGLLLGTSEQEISVTEGSPLKVTLASLFEPGPTREIGLLSISSNGQRSQGESRQPSISADGNFVAFASDANFDSRALTFRSNIFLRNRSSGTTSLLSAGTTSAANATDPHISDDGRFILFTAGSLYLRDRGVAPVRVSLGSRFGSLLSTGIQTGVSPSTRLVAPVTDRGPQISGDGQWIAYSVLGNLFVQNRATQKVTLIDKSVAQPSLSSDGRFLAYLRRGNAVLVKDRDTNSTRAFLQNEDPGDVQISGDGRWLAVRCNKGDSFSGPLKLIDQQTGRITDLVAEIEGSPSISRDGRYLTFMSKQNDLVFNDTVGTRDAFSWDRDTGTFARVNVASDGTAVEGTVEGRLTDNGLLQYGSPSLSADGSRIAFTSKDSFLVPGDNNHLADIFSAVVPTPGLLYVSSGNKILRLNNAVLARGNVTGATTTVFEGAPGSETGQLYLDTANDRLFAVVGNGVVRMFNQASSRSSSEASSAFSLSATGIAGDPARGKVYVSRTITANRAGISVLEFDASGNPVSGNSFFTNFGNGNALLVDSRLDLLYLGSLSGLNLPGVAVFRSASTLSGLALPLSQLQGTSTQLSNVFALEWDASPLTSPFAVGQNLSNLMVLSGPLQKPGALSVFQATASSLSSILGDLPPLRVIQGASTGLQSPGTATQMSVDRFTGATYVGTPTSIRVFHRAASAQGNVAPDRIINLPAQGLALDRTR